MRSSHAERKEKAELHEEICNQHASNSACEEDGGCLFQDAINHMYTLRIFSFRQHQAECLKHRVAAWSWRDDTVKSAKAAGKQQLGLLEN